MRSLEFPEFFSSVLLYYSRKVSRRILDTFIDFRDSIQDLDNVEVY